MPQFSGQYSFFSLRGIGICLAWLPVFPLLLAMTLPGDWGGREGKTRRNQKQGTLLFSLTHRNLLSCSLDRKEKVFLFCSFKKPCYGLNYTPTLNSYVKVLTFTPQNRSLFENRLIADVISSAKIRPHWSRVVCQSNMMVSSYKGKLGHQYI